MLIRLPPGSVGDTKCCHLLWTASWQELVANQGGLTLFVVLFHSSLHATIYKYKITSVFAVFATVRYYRMYSNRAQEIFS